MARVLSAVRPERVQSARGQRRSVPADGLRPDHSRRTHGATGVKFVDGAARPGRLLHSTNQRAHADGGAIRRKAYRPIEDDPVSIHRRGRLQRRETRLGLYFCIVFIWNFLLYREAKECFLFW